MPISKTIQAPNGASVSFHKAMQASIDLAAATVSLNVASWTTIDDYLAGSPLTWMWPVDLVLAAVSNFDAALVQIEPFTGATILADPAVTLPAVKARTWARIKDTRDAAIYAGLYAHMGLTDAVDNGLATVSGDPSVALGAWVVANLNVASALRAQIEGATTADALTGLSFPILP